MQVKIFWIIIQPFSFFETLLECDVHLKSFISLNPQTNKAAYHTKKYVPS